MPFEAANLMLVGLVKIELPGQDIRICDGNFIYFNAEKYESSDADFGSIEAVEAMQESVGDEAPGGRLSFLPASAAAAGTLSQPEYQGSRMRFWLASVNEATGLVIDAELVADMELDTTTLRGAKGQRLLDMEFVSVAERLFNTNEGNVLSSRFHETVWTGELGFDNATGVPNQVAWGVKSPPRGSTTSTAIFRGLGRNE